MNNLNRPNGEDTVQVAHENLILSILISALDEDPGYIETADCRHWLDTIGLKDSEGVKDALLATGGKVNDKRYIAERMED
tara:strand:- start:694 stop:933 length:240 start_codon:yes stop_codon:yes gene_type:complete